MEKNNRPGKSETPETEYENSDKDLEERYRLPGQYETYPRYFEGSLLEGAAIEASSYVQVDHEMAFTSALGVISAVCQGLVDVSFPNNYTVPASLMMLTLANSGERKTALDSLLCQPLREVQKLKDEVYREEYQGYQRDLDIWKLKEKTLKKLLQKRCENGDDTFDIVNELHELDKDQPQKPRACKLIYSDTTPSALAYSMYQNVPMAYLLSDEGGASINGHAFRDFNLLNSIWSGSEVAIDRKASESFTLRNARLSVTMMIQPEVFKRFMQKRGKEAHESGFLSRYIVSCPVAQAGSRDKLSHKGELIHVKKFQERVRKRLEMSLEVFEGKRQKKTLSFTASACEFWEYIYGYIEREIKSDGVYAHAHAHAHASKLMDNITRVAALLHTFEKDDYQSEITKKDLRYAFCFCRYHSSHFINNVAGQPEVVEIANILVREIRKRAQNNVGSDNYYFTKTTVTQSGNPKLRVDGNFDRAVELLIKLGHLSKTIRNNTTQYTFSEIIQSTIPDPELKNGELYHVDELCRFSDQEYVKGRRRSFYQLKKGR